MRDGGEVPSPARPGEAAASRQVVVRASGLGHRYQPAGMPPVTALADVSFSVYAGERVAIVGATGSGKSTLVQHFNGLLTPSSGRLEVLGEEMTPERPLPAARARALRFRVGLVFQSPEDQLFEETVAADVAFGPKNQGFPPSQVQERVDWALRQVGLAPEVFGRRSPWALSGGEQRRVALAGVLAMQPEILVLDEPTVGLDPAGRDTLIAEIRQYQAEGGRTVAVVTHDMELMMALAERVLVLARGRLVFDGSLSQLLARGEEQLRLWGLVPPPLVRLVARLRAAGWPVDEGCSRVQEVARQLREATRRWR
ncbi:MAG: energy-coupling factor transporter ATPase [Limnochordaceae bacterium]|nr:energy-coupling factor transporter ATPase [Limnochordaceae bacterium]